MVTLAVVLVLAVGFVAFGALLPSATVLLVFGASFLAASIFFIGKLLVVSHVHLRGAAARLEALNDRYDDTARWLERFDKDTRESFAVAKRRLEAADSGRNQLSGSLEKLAKDTAPLKLLKELEEKVSAAHAKLASSIESVEASHNDARGELERLIKEGESSVAKRVEGLRSELPDIEPLEERVRALQTDGAALRSEIEAASTRAAELAETATSASAAELSTARTELEDHLRKVNGRVSKLDDEHDRKRRSAVHAAKQEASESIAKLSKRVEETAQLSSRVRGEGYARFSRVLSGEAIKASSAFGAKVQPAHLKYLERKLQMIEGLCEGRLAGSIDDAVGRALAGHLVRGKELRILEIGVLFGVGAAFMHHALAPRHERVSLTLLDPFQGYYGKDHLDPPTGLPVTRAAVERNLARCGIDADDVTFIEGFSGDDSIRAAAEESGPYHIIVIDGDHSAEGVRADFEGYADMLRSGGVLIIDDYGSDDWPAVTTFVDETVRSDPRFKAVAVIGKTAVFKRVRTPGTKKVAKAGSNRGETKAESAKAVDAAKQDADAADATPNSAKASGAKRSSAKRTSKKAAAKPSVDAEAQDAPVVETPRRSKKKAAKKKPSANETPVPAAADGSGDAAP